MPDREKVIKGLECCVEKLDTVVNKSHGFNCIVCPYFRKCDRSGYLIGLPLMRDAIALLKEYDEALKLMVYQYCTMKPLTVNDEVFHNKFMSAGEAAFRLLGLENWQSTDGVWERWFPNG